MNTTPKIHLRTKTHNGSFEIVFTEADGSRKRHSLGTKCLEEASERVPQAYQDHVEREYYLNRPLICDFQFMYMDAIQHMDKTANASWNSRRNNINRLNKVLRYCGINVDKDDITALARKAPNGTHIAEWYRNSTGASASTMRQAKSVFSKRMIRYYKDVKHLDVSWFSDWVALDCGKSSVKPFRRDDAERERITARCASLKYANPEMFKAYLLAFGCGMRSSEIRRARYEDFGRSGDETFFLVHKPKCITGATESDSQERVCERQWYNEVMSFGASGKIITASDQLIVREFPQFLRSQCGMSQEQYPVHRLRKYAGDRIYRDNGNSMEAAAHALGHTNLEITRKIYTGRPLLRHTA